MYPINSRNSRLLSPRQRTKGPSRYALVSDLDLNSVSIAHREFRMV